MIFTLYLALKNKRLQNSEHIQDIEDKQVVIRIKIDESLSILENLPKGSSTIELPYDIDNFVSR